VSFPYNAAHTLDIQYLFPRFHGAQGTPRPLNAKQQNLSTDMISYWTNFAAKGHPNSKAAPAWLPYTAANEQLQLLDLPRPRSATEKDTGVDRKCAFWDQL
jgi:para-nitrobenzyl esterase